MYEQDPTNTHFISGCSFICGKLLFKTFRLGFVFFIGIVSPPVHHVTKSIKQTIRFVKTFMVLNEKFYSWLVEKNNLKEVIVSAMPEIKEQ